MVAAASILHCVLSTFLYLRCHSAVFVLCRKSVPPGKPLVEAVLHHYLERTTEASIYSFSPYATGRRNRYRGRCSVQSASNSTCNAALDPNDAQKKQQRATDLHAIPPCQSDSRTVCAAAPPHPLAILVADMDPCTADLHGTQAMV